MFSIATTALRFSVAFLSAAIFLGVFASGHAQGFSKTFTDPQPFGSYLPSTPYEVTNGATDFVKNGKFSMSGTSILSQSSWRHFGSDASGGVDFGYTFQFDYLDENGELQSASENVITAYVAVDCYYSYQNGICVANLYENNEYQIGLDEVLFRSTDYDAFTVPDITRVTITPYRQTFRAGGGYFDSGYVNVRFAGTIGIGGEQDPKVAIFYVNGIRTEREDAVDQCLFLIEEFVEARRNVDPCHLLFNPPGVTNNFLELFSFLDTAPADINESTLQRVALSSDDLLSEAADNNRTADGFNVTSLRTEFLTLQNTYSPFRLWESSVKTVLSDNVFQHVAQISTTIRDGEKPILFAYSQGNFFASIYSALLSESDRNQLFIMSIANPHVKVGVDGSQGFYVTTEEDSVVKRVKKEAFERFGYGTLGPNRSNGFSTDGLFTAGHDLIEDYSFFNSPSFNKIDQDVESILQAIQGL